MDVDKILPVSSTLGWHSLKVKGEVQMGKGLRWIPRHPETRNGVVSDKMLQGVENKHISGDSRIGQPFELLLNPWAGKRQPLVCKVFFSTQKHQSSNMPDPVSLLVTPIIDFTLKKIASVIKDNFNLIQGVEKEIKNLESTSRTIQGVLEDAEHKQLKDHLVQNWLDGLSEAAFDMEDILERWATEYNQWKMNKQVSNFLPTFWVRKTSFQYDVALEIKKIAARLEKIAKEKEQFKLDVVQPKNETPGTHTSSVVTESNVVGRDSDKENVIKLLISDEKSSKDGVFSVIPIIGMGGLGKTTLAQIVYNDEGVNSHFRIKMWVCVTADFNLTRILTDMLPDSELKQGLDSLSMEQLQLRIQEFLTEKQLENDGDSVPTSHVKRRGSRKRDNRPKRFLLVLDDVWTDNDNKWRPLKTLLEKGVKGSRVLITGRDTNISNIMGLSEPYFLSYLPPDECWSLFQKSAFTEGSSTTDARKDLEECGRAIVQKCGGLPLAIVHMGSLLCGKAVREWKKIMESEIWETENQTILPALRLSFNHLSNSNLKQCFAFCSIFSKSFEFDKNELVKLWMAENFIEPNPRERTEDIGSNYFETLLMRFFFQKSSSDSTRYRMHDLIHDLAQSISRRYCCQVKDSMALSDISEKTLHVSLFYKEQVSLDFIDRSKKLRTLLLPGRKSKAFEQSLDNMFHTLRYLRVLDLSSSTLLALPKSIKLLTLLRYLDLSKTEIRKLPNSICSLYNLQTLKLLGCPWLFELPKDLGNLISLRYLELDAMFWYKLSMLPQKMGSLTGLHNLQDFEVGQKSGNGIEELGSMVYLMGTLRISKLENAKNADEAKLKDKERLRKLVLEWSDRDVNLLDEAAKEKEKKALEDLQPYTDLEELQICYYMGSGFPNWMGNGLLKNLVTLHLSHCTKCKILSLDDLPHLEELYIKGMQDLEEWQGMQYPSLNRLKISRCPKLRELPIRFPKLSDLKIKKCESLEALPIAPLVHLTLVDNLALQQWNEADYEDEGKIWENHSLVHLLNLKVINCPSLKALPKNIFLEKLDISGCKSLSDLPYLDLLQHLALDACDERLVKSISDTSTLYSLVISNISNLESLPKLLNLPAIKSLYIRDCKDLVSLLEPEDGSLLGLTSLKLLSIQNCPKLVTLPAKGLPTSLEHLSIGSCRSLKSFGPKDLFKSLTVLNDLYIEDCHKLQSLPEEGLSSSLQHLCIEGCPALMERCQKEGGDWQKIKDIPDLEIETASSTPLTPRYHRFTCCRGIDIIESKQPQQQPNSRHSMQRGKGQSSNGKTEPAESSKSDEHRRILKGKSVVEVPSSTAAHGQSSEGKMVLAEPSSSAEHGQSSKGTF